MTMGKSTMTVKAYQKKYKLMSTKKFNREDFVADMKNDFLQMLASQGIDIKHPTKKRIPVTRFNNIIDQMYSKWLSVFCQTKVDMEHAESLWGFFFATVAGPWRAQTFQVKRKFSLDRETRDTKRDEAAERLVESVTTGNEKTGKKNDNTRTRLSNGQIRRHRRY
jgi:hypothetical protein